MGLKSMNAGDGETSYARNSGLQKTVMTKTIPVLDETLKDMCKALNGFPKGMKIADLGCATGPNTLFFVSHMIDTIQDLCEQNNLPSLEVFLNDLPDNDFNNLFKLLPSFNENKKKLECFMYGVPGSFYGRLFPTKSLHFVYSSYSLHWLSQVPEGVGKNNKENIYMAVSSPPQVLEAYAKQFQRDFFRFLSFRGQETVVGGRMVLTFIARSLPHFSPNDGVAQIFSPLAEILLQMVAQGCVKAEDLYRFNVPVYTPCLQEIEAIVSEQGSFHLDQMETCEVPWDASYDVDKVLDKHRSGKVVADCVRAFMEPILLSHFGTCLNLDRLFHCYADKMADHLSTQTSSYFSPVISLTRSYNYNDCMKCAEGRKCPCD